MVKKVITLEKIPTPAQKRSMQRRLAELTNVQDVAFEENRMILHLYSRTPAETLLEDFPPLWEVPIVAVE